MERYDAIYGRQSVDRVDSISIESQVEFCQYETRGEKYKTFIDRGYSGKNLDRPQFQAMLEAIRRGEIKRVIVYKLDRISRSILDFANMMAEFQNCHVEFVSCTEKFDTSTPMGRAMLNICIVFAQLERETIQMRVEDAYLSRSRRGFYMGGRVPFGFRLEPYLLEGKKTRRYAADDTEANIVRQIFSLYAAPQVSYGDIVKYLQKNGIANSRNKDGSWNRCRIADMIKNPIYCRADMDIYCFFKEQGTEIHNRPEDFAGIFGCYLFTGKNAGKKQTCLAGQHLVMAPHEGLVPSDIWLKARRKCLGQKQAARPSKAKNTWLAGKIKCGKCGYALTVKKSKTRIGRYLICSHRLNSHTCEGVGGIDAGAMEHRILQEMIEKVKEFEVLRSGKSALPAPEIQELTAKIEDKKQKIEGLLQKMPEADSVLMGYINRCVHDLDAEVRKYKEELSRLLTAKSKSVNNSLELKNYMQHWDKLAFDDKRAVSDQLIVRISTTEDSCDIIWRI